MRPLLTSRFPGVPNRIGGGHPPLALCNADARIYRQIFKALPQAAGPPDLEFIDRGEIAEAEVLLGRQAAEIASVVDHAMLLTAAGHQFQPRADARRDCFVVPVKSTAR